MPIIEILDGRLWQADADPNIFAKIREREWSPVMVIDLQEFPARGIPLDGDILYVHWPIDDGPVPDVRMLLTLERAACTFMEQGGRVVTMCAQGRNRSGLLSALIVGCVLGCDGAEAVRRVRSKAPEALSNPEFVDWLHRR
jgi:protein-tyrosine phosphatase